jgi:hypothetical protein
MRLLLVRNQLRSWLLNNLEITFAQLCRNNFDEVYRQVQGVKSKFLKSFAVTFVAKFRVTNLRKERSTMQSFELCETWQPKETDLKSGLTPDNNLGLPLDLLREGRNLRIDENVQPSSAYKDGYPPLPELTLSEKSADFDPQYEEWAKAGWTDDVAKWGRRFFKELKDFGVKVLHGLENIKPGDLLDLAKDLAVVGAKFGTQIGADIARVIKSKGMDPIADAKLVIDLVDFAKSPEAAHLADDAKKILRDFMEKYGLTR